MFQVNLVLLKIAALFRQSIFREKLLVHPDPDLFPGPVRFFLPVHQNIDFRFCSAGIFENSRLINLSSNKLKLIENRIIFIKLSCFRWSLFCSSYSISQFSWKNCWSTRIRIYFRFRSDFYFWSTRILISVSIQPEYLKIPD